MAASAEQRPRLLPSPFARLFFEAEPGLTGHFLGRANCLFELLGKAGSRRKFPVGGAEFGEQSELR